MEILQNKFGFTVTDCQYINEEAIKIKELIGDGRFVVIKNENRVNQKIVVDFYKMMGICAAQNEHITTGDEPELVEVSADALFAGDDLGELEYHCAAMNRDDGENIISMYMDNIGITGGDTYFTDAQTAYDDLPVDIKKTIENINSKLYNFGTVVDAVYPDEKTRNEFKNHKGVSGLNKQLPRKKLVTVHPINGKKGLFFPWSIIRGFTGMKPIESKNLYKFLKTHTMSEKYIYKHVWENNDIVLSDQNHSLHKRDAYTGPRRLYRSAIWV